MPAEKRDEEELGALWEKTSLNGTQMLTGNISGVDVVCFLAKRTSDKSPTWRVLKSRPRPDQTARTVPRPQRAGPPPVDDDDVPF